MQKLVLHDATSIYSTFRAGGWVFDENGKKLASPASAGMTFGDRRVSEIQKADPTPDGKQSTGKEMQIVNGIPKWVHTLEDVPPVYATAEEAYEAMIAWVDAFNRTVTGPVPADEKLAWVYKDAAARAIDAGTADAAQLALIDAEAAITGETREDLAAKIIVKSNLYRQVVAAVSGLRRKTGAAIDAASDPYQYEAILAAAQAEAAALATSLGL